VGDGEKFLDYEAQGWVDILSGGSCGLSVHLPEATSANSREAIS
jgi:hypothetical protein